MASVAPTSLSVVIPVFNEAAHLAVTIAALREALKRADFAAEIVVVDDGSSDGSGVVAQEAVDGQLPLQVVTQTNQGRFEARRLGVEAAQGEYVLLLDGRVQIHPDALAYVCARLSHGDRVWTAHVDVDAGDELLGLFWKLIADLAWSDYFDDPRAISFGSDDFDKYPKGTTCFLAPRVLLLDAIGSFWSRYADPRQANDDTPLLLWIDERESIHISPDFRCSYRPRVSLRSFLSHSVHRGIVFLDAHSRPESRFFTVAVAFFPVSAALVYAVSRKPAVAPATLAAISLGASVLGLVRRRSTSELMALAFVTPLYGVAHGYGMWRGLVSILRQPLRDAAPPYQRPRTRGSSRSSV